MKTDRGLRKRKRAFRLPVDKFGCSQATTSCGNRRDLARVTRPATLCRRARVTLCRWKGVPCAVGPPRSYSYCSSLSFLIS